MAFCGIAVSRNDSVAVHEMDSMCLHLTSAEGQSESCTSPQVQLRITISKSSSILSSDDLLVACDTDLYNSDLNQYGSAANLISDYYRRHGISFLEKLHGAFSLAIWDVRLHSLILAVDRFGIKTLCYAERGSAIIFAPRSGAVLASGRIQAKVNLAAITDYLTYSVVPIPQTSFEGVRKVAPGEYLVWTEEGASSKRYWNMHYSEDAQGSPRELAHELFTRMNDAVRRASAGLDLLTTGCFLSGGTDSSSIVGLLTRQRSAPVNAFSIGFSEERFNELEYARLAAKHFGSRHTEGRLGSDDAADVIPKIVAAYDEPFANSSVIPTYWCAQLARDRGMDVLLAGDGGDELFGGNERYRKEQIFNLYQRVPRSLRQLIEPTVFSAAGVPGVEKVRNYILTANMGNPERYCRWRLLRKFSPDEILGSNMPFRNGHRDLLSVMRAHFAEAPAHSELNRLLYVDVKMTLGDDDLPKVTKAAELAGITVRFPYLDHELADFSGRLPAHLKVLRLEKRYLFKLATRQLLPSAILNKKKHGFGLPIGLWLKTNVRLNTWAQDVMFDPKTYQRGYFRREFIEQLFGHMDRDATPYFGDLLWVFLILELWHRQHVDAAGKSLRAGAYLPREGSAPIIMSSVRRESATNLSAPKVS